MSLTIDDVTFTSSTSRGVHCWRCLILRMYFTNVTLKMKCENFCILRVVTWTYNELCRTNSSRKLQIWTKAFQSENNQEVKLFVPLTVLLPPAGNRWRAVLLMRVTYYCHCHTISDVVNTISNRRRLWYLPLGHVLPENMHRFELKLPSLWWHPTAFSEKSGDSVSTGRCWQEL